MGGTRYLSDKHLSFGILCEEQDGSLRKEVEQRFINACKQEFTKELF